MKKIIVLSVATVAILTFSGCGDNKKEEAAKTVEQTQNVAQNAKDAAANAANSAKEAVNKATESAKEAAAEAANKAKEAANKAVEATKEAANKAAESAKNAAAEVANKAKEAVAANTNEKGAALFKKCVGCHGADGKTKALGKSAIIAGQSAEDLVKKMQEYKAGTRNVAGMGALMKGQVAGLSDEDIKALADYISNLK